MGIFALIKRGKDYMQLWPNEPILNAIYPEVRIKSFMNIATKVVPPLFAFLLFWVYYQCGGFKGLYFILVNPGSVGYNLYLSITSVLIVAIALLFLPVHGLIWFGYRSLQPLSEKLTVFYVDLMKQMDKTPQQNPTMFDFIQAVNDGLKFFKDKEFLERL